MIKNCEICGKGMKVDAYLLKKGYGKYCSRKCNIQSQSKKIRVQCKTCNGYYYVSPSRPANGIAIYCSKECYTQAQKKGLYPPWNKGNKTFNAKSYFKKYGLSWRRKNRETVFKHYGQKCACCGETIFDFLTIDHIDGKGCEHRRQIKTDIYRWLIKNDYPAGFQVLCFNCNCAKGFYGICPHKRGVANG